MASKVVDSGVRYEWYQTDAFVVVTILLKNKKPKNINVDINDTLVEIKLKKFDGCRWNTLEDDEKKAQSASMMLGALGSLTHNYPSSSFQKHDWDKIVGDIQKNEDEEEKKLSGEAAVSKLFEKIYSEGSEEVRRAMNKSFMESGGTVLSTNWKEVSKETVSVKPPEGMEFKKWEQ